MVEAIVVELKTEGFVLTLCCVPVTTLLVVSGLDDVLLGTDIVVSVVVEVVTGPVVTPLGG